MGITAISDWNEAIMASITGVMTLLLGAIPKVLAFLVITIIGWIIASLAARALGATLYNLRFNELSNRSGFSRFLTRTGVQSEPSEAIAGTLKWSVRLLTLIVAFDALGLPAVSEVLNQLLLWLPNLVVALVILVIAGLAANALHSIVRGATVTAGFSGAEFLAEISRIAVWGFGIVVVLTRIGIATNLVNTLFMGFVGAIALAIGLAFGLGASDTAGEIIRSWYRNQQAARKMEEDAEAREKVHRRGKQGERPLERLYRH